MDPNFAIAHYELARLTRKRTCMTKQSRNLKRAIQLSGDNEYSMLSRLCLRGIRKAGRSDENGQGTGGPQNLHSSTDANIALIYVGLGDRTRR